MQDSTCDPNPLGSSKTHVDNHKKLNTLEHPWEKNPLLCKWPGILVYQLVSQVLIHTHSNIPCCESGLDNTVFNRQLHDHLKEQLHGVHAEQKLGVGKYSHPDLIDHCTTQRYQTVQNCIVLMHDSTKFLLTQKGQILSTFHQS